MRTGERGGGGGVRTRRGDVGKISVGEGWGVC